MAVRHTAKRPAFGSLRRQSIEADEAAAMALLAQQTVDEKHGRPRAAEDGFAGSALLGGSFPSAPLPVASE